jgi:hypothetical protein
MSGKEDRDVIQQIIGLFCCLQAVVERCFVQKALFVQR